MLRTRVRTRIELAAAFALLLALACASPIKLLPGKPHVTEVAIDLPRERVFQEIVSVMHGDSFDVAVVESASGVLRLEPKSFEGPIMDAYCLFPAVYQDSGRPVNTFARYHQERLKDGRPGVTGSVALSFLVTERNDGGTNVNLRSRWEVTNGDEQVDCESTGKLEDGLIDEVKAGLLAPPRG